MQSKHGLNNVRPDTLQHVSKICSLIRFQLYNFFGYSILWSRDRDLNPRSIPLQWAQLG